MQTLCDILERVRVADRPDLLKARPAPGEAFADVSAADWLRGIELCAQGLWRHGVRRGDRVGLLCSNRPEWHVIDFACQRLGAVLVPLFTTLNAEQVGYCLADSGCRLVLVEGLEQLDKLAACSGNLQQLRSIVFIGALGEAPPSIDEIDLFELVELLRPAPDPTEMAGPDGPQAVASIIYTSGTTGLPKGVILTHGSFLANIDGIQQSEPVLAEDIGLSLLPLCHIYERTLDYVYLAAGARIAYGAPGSVAADFKEIRPSLMIGVPRLYQKLQAAVDARFEQAGTRQEATYRRALASGIRHARARLGGPPEGLWNKLMYPLWDFLVLSKVREVAGGRMRVFSGGGAAIEPALAWWFQAVGWDLVQGYGMTECLIISTNRRLDNRVGSVGRPLYNVEVRLAEDGEILTRGAHLMVAYWQRPQETAAVLEGGWLHTGDIGKIDADGFLWITDRKKSLLVTSTGKKVAPQPLESALLASPWIEQVMAIGDDRKFVSALIVPNWPRLQRWAQAHGLSSSAAELTRNEQVRELLERDIEPLQAGFAEYERARDFRLLKHPFTLECGQLTPTLKPIRHRIAEDYSALIEEIYAD